MEKIDEVIYAIFQTEFVSPIEAAMYFSFKKIGVEVEKQVTIDKYRVDYLLGKTIIECDGREFHTGEQNEANDRKRDRVCLDLGYRVVRIPGHCINRRRHEIACYLVWRYAPEKATPQIINDIPRDINHGLYVMEFMPQGYYQKWFVARTP